MTTVFHHVELFGGAITANIPVNFTDVRLVRTGSKSQPGYSAVHASQYEDQLLIPGVIASYPASADPPSSHSKIRQVPDNQEVYLDKDGFTSLTFDITERVSHLSTDKEALEYHLADIVAETDTQNTLSIVENLELPHFPSTTPILALTAVTKPPASAVAAKAPAPAHTDIHITLIRLVEQSTDIVITLNIPYIVGEADGRTSNSTAAGITQQEIEQEARNMHHQIGTSFMIKDWGLFSGE